MRRPVRNLREIIGQEPVVRLLLRALEKDRLHHAYLFAGEEGVGKETTARALVYHLFCEMSSEHPCGSCPSCQRLDKGIHQDLFVMEPEKREIKIGQVRALEKELYFRPVNAPYLVVIIKQAERMNPEAANALLKSLEEPPSYVIFILLAENPSRLLPTIQSRCQLVRFGPLSKALIKEELIKRLGLEEGYATTLADLSAGSLGRALDLAAKGLLEELHAFVSAGTSGKPSARFRVAERLAKLSPEDQRKFLGLVLIWVVRSYLKAKAEMSYPQGLPTKPYGGSPFNALKLVERFEQALESYVNPELTFYNLILSLFANP